MSVQYESLTPVTCPDCGNNTWHREERFDEKNNDYSYDVCSRCGYYYPPWQKRDS